MSVKRCQNCASSRRRKTSSMTVRVCDTTFDCRITESPIASSRTTAIAGAVSNCRIVRTVRDWWGSIVWIVAVTSVTSTLRTFFRSRSMTRCSRDMSMPVVARPRHRARLRELG